MNNNNHPTENIIQEEGNDLTYYLNLLLRRRFSFLLVFVLIFGGTLTYNFTRPPEYRSSSTFVVDTKDFGFDPMAGINLTTTVKPFGFYEALIKSRIFRERVRQLVLENSSLTINGDIKEEDLIKIINDNISIRTEEYSELITLNARAYSPYVAYEVAKVATDMLKIRSREIDQEETNNIISFVDIQIDLAKTNLENSEIELHKFKETTNINIISDGGGLLKRLTELEIKQAEIQTERELSQANLAAYDKRLEDAVTGTETGFETEDSPEVKKIKTEILAIEEEKDSLLQTNNKKTGHIAQLNKRIEEKRNELIELILISALPKDYLPESEKSILIKIKEKKITEEINLFTLKNRENYYQRLIDNYKKKHPNMWEHAIELARLQRAKTIYENMYNFLVKTSEEAKIKSATGTGGIRIIDPAGVPNTPISVKTAKNLMLGFIFGIMCGFGLAVLLEYFDNTFKTSEEITSLLKLPVLAVVPTIRKKYQKIKIITSVINSTEKKDNNHKHIDDKINLLTNIKSSSPIFESYRSLRTNLQFTQVDKPLRSILITSSGPNEGKTLTSANLAISYAELGKKTLIIDCDLRKPRVHKMFGIKKAPGLVDHLLMDTDLETVTHKTQTTNLSVMSCGKTPPNPTEILSSHKFLQFLKDIQEKYDLVIVDSSPIIAVTDPMILSALLDGVILVIKFSHTNKRMAVDAKENLRIARANIIGTILNNAEYKRGYGYYHYRYYYHSYYYSHKEKEKSKV